MWTVKGVPLLSGVCLSACVPSVTELPEYLMTISFIPLFLNAIFLIPPTEAASTPQVYLLPTSGQLSEIRAVQSAGCALGGVDGGEGCVDGGEGGVDGGEGGVDGR